MDAPLEQRLEALRGRIPEVAPTAAADDQRQGALVLDVREPVETAQGYPQRAQLLPRGMIELQAASLPADRDAPIRVICATGVRSLLAADTLAAMGYRDVASITGGFDAWRAAGLPVARPASTAPARDRYQRQLMLPEVGAAGQERLAAARVLIVGAGGLGSPAALYLAGAGVGTIGLVDDDRVELSNLHRQPLHTEAGVGTPKVESARSALQARNAGIAVETHDCRLAAGTAAALVAGYDVVLDCSDNFAARYLLNDACVAAGTPLVQAAIHRFEGQLTVIHPAAGGPCYRCLYPEPPPAELAPSCGETGVLGVVPGHLGVLQAAEALKLVLGIGEPLIGRLLWTDLLTTRFRRLEVKTRADCPLCTQPRLEAIQS